MNKRLALSCVFALLLASCAGNGAPRPALPAIPSGAGGLQHMNGPVAISEFTASPYVANQHVLGGLTVTTINDVFVSTDAYFGLVHFTQNGVPNPIHAYYNDGDHFFPPNGGIVWRSDGDIAYQIEFGEGAELGITTATGYNVTGPIDLAKYGTDSEQFVNGGDGRVWFARCNSADYCGNTAGGDVYAYHMYDANATNYSIDPWIGNSIVAIGNHELAVSAAQWNGPQSAVLIVSAAGTILHTWGLPNNSVPNQYNTPYTSSGIAEGADGYIYAAEPPLNEIAKINANGVVVQIPLPTANAGLHNLVLAQDGNVWFTEYGANKIGRLTPAGAITEYPVPTANAGADGIATCVASGCARNQHGYVWFTETNSDAVGRLAF